jgi:hypothetical protein
MVLYVATKKCDLLGKEKRPVLNLINHIILQHPIAIFT